MIGDDKDTLTSDIVFRRRKPGGANCGPSGFPSRDPALEAMPAHSYCAFPIGYKADSEGLDKFVRGRCKFCVGSIEVVGESGTLKRVIKAQDAHLVATFTRFSPVRTDFWEYNCQLWEKAMRADAARTTQDTTGCCHLWHVFCYLAGEEVLQTIRDPSSTASSSYARF